MIVGAYLYDADESEEGAAFVFLGSNDGIIDGDSTTAATRLESDQVYSGFGASASSAGDVNGDGFSDVIVGAPSYDTGINGGAAFIFHGSATGIANGDPSTAATRIGSDQAQAAVGYGVASAGDVNGDGYADVIINSRYDAGGPVAAGVAFIFHGSSAGIADGDPSSADTWIRCTYVSCVFQSVASAGDVNGDGYADVIVGSPFVGDNWPSYSGGYAFILHGSAVGIAGQVSRIESDQRDAFLGRSVASAADVNGDGYADVIVGADYYDAGEDNEGAAFIFLGSATGIANDDTFAAATRIESNQAGAQLGGTVASAGDVNGDGYADVIVGTQYYDGSEPDEGAAFVFHGGAGGVPSGNPSTVSTQLSRLFHGGAAGDLNGDGYGDVITQGGYIFLGSANGIPSGDQTTAVAQVGPGLGSGAGDVNGDGYADVIVGVGGSAYIFLGNQNSPGRPVVAQQGRGDGSGTPVQPWGGSYDEDSFEVQMTATHPEGRGRVKLEIEICASGVPFTSGSCIIHRSKDWTDVTATPGGVVLTETPTGLTAGRLYRWRARVLYAPFSITEPGIIEPANPAHGPWRRLYAQANEADIRVVPEPVSRLTLVAGMAFLGLLYRRRARIIRPRSET